jgi:hypothetical protein
VKKQGFNESKSKNERDKKKKYWHFKGYLKIKSKKHYHREEEYFRNNACLLILVGQHFVRTANKKLQITIIFRNAQNVLTHASIVGNVNHYNNKGRIPEVSS